MLKLHTLFSKTPSAIISKPGHQEFIELDRTREINEYAYDLMFNLLIKGIRNYSGNLTFEKHHLKWELKTGDNDLSLTDSLKIEFLNQLHKNNIDASISIKNYENTIHIWIIFKNNTSLETDIQVNKIFRNLENQHPDLNMSLFMASEDELNGAI